MEAIWSLYVRYIATSWAAAAAKRQWIMMSGRSSTHIGSNGKLWSARLRGWCIHCNSNMCFCAHHVPPLLWHQFGHAFLAINVSLFPLVSPAVSQAFFFHSRFTAEVQERDKIHAFCRLYPYVLGWIMGQEKNVHACAVFKQLEINTFVVVGWAWNGGEQWDGPGLIWRHKNKPGVENEMTWIGLIFICTFRAWVEEIWAIKTGAIYQTSLCRYLVQIMRTKQIQQNQAYLSDSDVNCKLVIISHLNILFKKKKKKVWGTERWCTWERVVLLARQQGWGNSICTRYLLCLKMALSPRR